MRFYGLLGLLLLPISQYFLFRKVEPFYSWFYSFAWWSYILLADNLLLALRGRSLLTSRRGELPGMLPLSVLIWLLFEAYNLVINNWIYDGLPAQLWLRWPGYALAFATVLPGVFITADLCEALFFRRREKRFASEAEPLHAPPSGAPAPWFMALGAALCAAPLAWPQYFFSAVWLGPIFLLDPLLERLGLRSLSLHAASAERRRIWCLLLGGLACGIMWEFWNFWAGARWVYTVPFFGHLKIFEMPLLGFLGFPPFALECWVLYHLLQSVRRRLTSKPAALCFWLALGACCIAMFFAIDRNSVLRFGGQSMGGVAP